MKAGRLLLGVGILSLAFGSATISRGAPEPAVSSLPVPKLIVALSIDQFSSDLFNQYRASYTGGLKRLAGGVVFPSGFQSHAATETCPGHSTILTGSRPARSGIVANDWSNPRAPRIGANGKVDYAVYCAEDSEKPGSNSTAYVVSSKHLKVPSLGDRLKTADPATRVVSVSGKDRAAVMMGGHKADLTLWFGNKGGFETYMGQAVPSEIATVNTRAKLLIEKPTPAKLPAICASMSRNIPLSQTGGVGTLKPRKAGDARALRASPDFDSLTLDAALLGLRTMKLGQGKGTDVLAIGFSATDYVGHSTGTNGAEMCTNIIALDATLGRLFAALDSLKLPYAVVLTADHGGHDLPERNSQIALDSAARVNGEMSGAKIGQKLATQFGLTEPAIIGDFFAGDFYLSSKIPAEKRKAVSDSALAIWRGHAQVAAAFSREDIMAAPQPSGPPEEWSLMDRVKAGYDPERSGDFIILLKRYVTPIPSTGFGYVATHGSPWDYDRRVPILFWQKGIVPFEQPNGVETVDILPTLASLIGLTVPRMEIDGRCLDIVAGPRSNCTAPR